MSRELSTNVKMWQGHKITGSPVLRRQMLRNVVKGFKFAISPQSSLSIKSPISIPRNKQLEANKQKTRLVYLVRGGPRPSKPNQFSFAFEKLLRNVVVLLFELANLAPVLGLLLHARFRVQLRLVSFLHQLFEQKK